MENVITVGDVSFKVTSKNRPFGNKFVQQQAKIVQYKGVDEVSAVVLCVKGSKEPGRLYACIFSITGEMIACNTLN
jgi:hypothetical protein